jgi:hypothetical protein
MNDYLPSCPICGETLDLSLARGRKSGKPFVMLRCLVDGRHFRAFITHRPYVEKMLDRIEAIQQSKAKVE